MGTIIVNGTADDIADLCSVGYKLIGKVRHTKKQVEKDVKRRLRKKCRRYQAQKRRQ